MAGLFTTPEQQAAAEQQAFKQRFLQGGGVQAAAAGLGGSLAKAGGRALGVDTRSAAQKSAGRLQKVMGTIDMTDQASIQKGMQTLNAAGYQNEAFQLSNLLNAPTKPATTFGKMMEESFDVVDKDTGNTTTRRQWGQYDSNGKFNPSFAMSSSGELTDAKSGQNMGIDAAALSEITYNDDARDLFQNRFMDTVNSQQFGDLDGIEAVQGKGIEGKIVLQANDLRKQEIQQLVSTIDAIRASGTTLSKTQLQGLTSSMITPTDKALNQMYDQYVESGQFHKDVKQGVAGADPTVQVDGNESISLAETQQMQGEMAAKNAAVQKAADRTGKMVFGDPRKPGQFSMLSLNDNNMAPQKAIFTETLQHLANSNLSPEKAFDNLTQQGFNFSAESGPTHIARWRLMQENPVFTAKMITRMDNMDEFESQGLEEMDLMEMEDDFTAWAESKTIYDYLMNMTGPRKAKRRGRGNIGSN